MCRSGTLPMGIEKGRWRGIPRDERICRYCVTDNIDDLEHFLLDCPVLNVRRRKLLSDICNTLNVNDFEMNIYNLLTNDNIIKVLSTYIIDCMNSRN